MNIYMVRHAPVIGQRGMVYGDDVDIDLESCTKALSIISSQLPRTSQSAWFCSGIDRTIRTGEALLRVGGDNLSSMKIIDLFREQNFGSLIGKTYEEAKDYIQWYDGAMFIPNPPNGESIDSFVDRIRGGLFKCAQTASSAGFREAVVICHRGTIRAANLIMNQLPTSAFMEVDIEPLTMKVFNYQAA